MLAVLVPLKDSLPVHETSGLVAMRHSGVGASRSGLLGFPVFHDHLVSGMAPITDVIKGKTILLSEVAHLGPRVSEVAVIMGLCGVANSPVCFEISSIKNTFIF